MNKKLIKKLNDKKYRIETGLFLVEGEKNIDELLASDFIVEEIYGTEGFLIRMDERIAKYQMDTKGSHCEIIVTSENDLAKIGTLKTNNTGLAIVKQKTQGIHIETLLHEAKNNIVLALDTVRDPGNLGTILRIADWYGLAHIVASLSTTDFYNPKTIAAGMGSFARTNVSYMQLGEFLAEASRMNIPIIGAYLDGINTHTTSLPPQGILLMGSESHGVAQEFDQYVSERVTIPKFGEAESLNVSVATGILLDGMRRGK